MARYVSEKKGIEMIKYYTTNKGVLETINKPVKGCWINMVHPTEKECQEIEDKYNIDPDDLRAALDEEEISRVTKEDDYTLILVDIPTVEEREGKDRFVTIPAATIVHKDVLITVCLESTPILNFTKKNKPDVDTSFKTRMVLTLLLENAKLYLKYLRQINKKTEELEHDLHKSVENPVLLELMELGKSLLYFNTSLKSNTAVLEKLTKFQFIKKYEEDEDLMEDVLIETRQASEMADVYSGVINGTMDAYASIISNNMNVIQKFLATASIVIAIPSIIFDAYGMNISGIVPFEGMTHQFLIIVLIALVSSLLTIQYLKHKRMY